MQRKNKKLSRYKQNERRKRQAKQIELNKKLKEQRKSGYLYPEKRLRHFLRKPEIVPKDMNIFKTLTAYFDYVKFVKNKYGREYRIDGV